MLCVYYYKKLTSAKSNNEKIEVAENSVDK